MQRPAILSGHWNPQSGRSMPPRGNNEWKVGGRVGKKREGRASWFKIFLHQQALIDAVPDECAGKAIKAAMSYFRTGQEPDLAPLEKAVFSSFKQYIDESVQDYIKFSEAGQKGNNKRWGNEVSPPDTTLSPPDTPYREAEAEADTEALSNKQYAEADATANYSPMTNLAEMAEDRKLKIFGGELGKNVVLLSEQQIIDLLEKMGIDAFDHYVDKLATYIISNNAKPKNHYATILKWWKQDSQV